MRLLPALVVAFLTHLPTAVLAEPNGCPPPIKLGKTEPPPKSAGALPGSMDQYLDAALKMPLNPIDFTWSVGQQQIFMAPADSQLCLLTKVAGRFAGAGEHVLLDQMKLPNGQVFWRLSGTSGQPQLSASAVCVKKDRFTPGMAGNEKVFAATQPNLMHQGCSSARRVFPMLGPDAAHFINDIAGKFDGSGEHVRASGNSLYVSACSGYVNGGALGVRLNGAGQVKYYGAGGRTTVAAQATFRGWSQKQANWQSTQPAQTWVQGATWLAPVDAALCGLVEVKGNFDGYGESVAIVRKAHPGGQQYWKLEIENQAANLVEANVRCIARDQR